MSTSSGGGVLYLIFIQVASRLLTFSGNQFLLRYLSPSLLGIAVQLELVSVTVLYFARESLRVALQRQHVSIQSSTTQRHNSTEITPKTRLQAAVNLSYLPTFLGTVIGICLSSLYLRSAPSEVLHSADFSDSFYLYSLATLLELLSEPLFIVIQQLSLYSARAKAETGAAIARCLAACTTAVVLRNQGRRPSTLPFAIGQLAYAICLFGLYLRAANVASYQHHFSLSMRSLNTPQNNGLTFLINRFNKPILRLAMTLYMQSVFKLLLTQGDALILSILSSLADQGAFALASNYGGLLARLVFQPVEESSRNTFGRLVASNTPSSEETPPKSTISNTIDQALDHLATILHLYLLLALPLFTVAPYLIPVLVGQVIGTSWYTQATGTLLSAYSYYIPFMAVNGILDAFVTSVATPSQIRTQSVWMALFTAIHGIAAWFLLHEKNLGATGLVMANILDMSLRILWSSVFIQHWITANDRQDKRIAVKKLWSRILPSVSAIVASVAVAIGLNLRLKDRSNTDGKSRNIEWEWVSSMLLGISLIALTIIITEWNFLLGMLESMMPQRLTPRYQFWKSEFMSPETDKKNL